MTNHWHVFRDPWALEILNTRRRGSAPCHEQFWRALSKMTQVWNIIRGLLVKKVVDIGGASEEARRIRGSQYSKLSLTGWCGGGSA